MSNASVVSRVSSSTRSTLLLTRSIASATRPPPHFGRTRSSSDDAFFAVALNIGTDVFSNFETVTCRGSIRAAMRFRILTPVSFSSKCLRLSSPQRPMIRSMLLALASPVAAWKTSRGSSTQACAATASITDATWSTGVISRISFGSAGICV